MASWIVHLQIAEKLLDLVNEENQIQFIVGNIGPDCGKIVENSDDFENNYEEYLNSQSFGINSKMLIKAS